MITERGKRQLSNGLRSFQASVLVEGDVTREDLQRHFQENPADAVFIGECSATPVGSWGGKYTRFNFSYIHREYTYNDVYTATNIAAFNAAMTQIVGGYREAGIICAPANFPVETLFEKFYQRYGIFYPNYVSASMGGWQFGLCNYTFYLVKIQYRIDTATLREMEAQTSAEVKRLAQMLFLPHMPDVAKVYLAHNYLALTVKYFLNMDAAALEKSYQQSAYGALIRKKCVCQGYAEAFKRLMDAGGVPCQVVLGQIKGATYYHAWNIVRLNGGMDGYHVDVTWDISDTRPKYEYFGKSDAFFKGNRSWDESCYSLCYKTENIKMQAQNYVRAHRAELRANGVSLAVLDV